MLRKLKTQIFAVGAIAAFAFSSLASADADNDLQSWAADAGVSVDKVMKYPAMAARRNAEGLATYRVTIDRDGNVVKSKRTQKTTDNSLNAASRSVIRRADFPALPAGYEKDTMTFAVHLRYAIVSSYLEERALKRQGRVTGREVATNNVPFGASIEILEGDE